MLWRRYDRKLAERIARLYRNLEHFSEIKPLLPTCWPEQPSMRLIALLVVYPS